MALQDPLPRYFACAFVCGIVLGLGLTHLLVSKVQPEVEFTLHHIRHVYDLYGDQAYTIGEDVTQTQHALQAADLAMALNWTEAEVVGALLHDIGHLLGQWYQWPKMGEVGIMDHEIRGADWLKRRQFPQATVDLVRYHIAPKRYKAAVIPGYVEHELSSASQATLEFQGGPMTAEEVVQFEKHPLFPKFLVLRTIDDEAKLVNFSTRSWQFYHQMMYRVLLSG